MLITASRIKKFSPKAQDDLVAAIVNLWSAAEKIGLTTPLRAQHFMAQTATETGGFKRLDENLNYSASRLLAVFPNRVTPADAQRLAGHPQDIANHVYANMLGNGNAASGDGWRYRGSGFIQLTGRANFRDRGATIGMPLEAQPELARSPEPGFKAALAYWNARSINDPADANDIETVRRRVNGGKNGLSDARVWFARARSIFTAGESEALGTGQELAAVREQLAELGYPSPGAATESASADISEALAAFQRDNGLEPTGRYDDATLDALVDRPGISVPPEAE